MEPVDARSGLYLSENGSLLVVPALDGGWRAFTLDKWSRSIEIPDIDRIDASWRRAAEQPYGVSAAGAQTDVDLSGWQLTPTQRTGVGVVILHGSGDSDRSNGWYVYLAHVLATNGIDVVLPDKRGSGRSGGDWRNVSFQVLAEDGAAWFKLLKGSYPDARLGFVGVSQGGFIAPIASRLADADFAYAMSSSATTLTEQLRFEISNDVRDAGVPDFLNRPVTAFYARKARKRRPDFWQQNGDFVIIEAWAAWRGPMFIAYGELDEADNVPVEASVEALTSCCEADPTLVWKVYEDVGHSLTDVETRRFLQEMLDDMLSWIVHGSARAERSVVN